MRFHTRRLSIFSIPWCKKVKNDQKLKLRGPALDLFFVQLTEKEESNKKQIRGRSAQNVLVESIFVTVGVREEGEGAQAYVPAM